MVFVPNAPLSPAALGWGDGFPRAVPSDAVAALLGMVLPGDVVQTLLLLTVFVLGAAGAARLVPGPGLAARSAAALAYVWNPFLAERLLLGQWALLLGYAGLPWVVAAAARYRGPRDLPRVGAALVPAAIGGFSSAVLSALVALPIALLRPWRRAIAASAAVLGCLAVAALPWLVPALASAATTDPAAVDVFAVRADTPLGTVASLLSLGGIWNARAVPPGFAEPVGAVGRLVLSLVALTGWGWLLRRGPQPGFQAGLTAAAAAGLLVALAGTVEAGRGVLRALIDLWPGFGPLRDGHLYLAPLALLQAVGLAGAVQWWGQSGGRGTARGSRAATRLLAGCALLAPVVLLPGLAWGAWGTLRPVDYPHEWVTVQRLVSEDPHEGALLSLPWSAYRGFPTGKDAATVVLDPAIKMVDRPVVWNDALRVRDGEQLRVVAGEDPRAQRIAPLMGDDGLPRDTPDLAQRLAAEGVRYVLVDRTNVPEGSSLGFAHTGFTAVHDGPLLLLLKVTD